MEQACPAVCVVIPDDPGNWFRQVPVDVLSGAALLRQRGSDVSIWDMRLGGVPPADRFNVVAIITAPAERSQCYPLSLGMAADAARMSREVFDDATLIAYGPHANHLPHDTADRLGADIVASGESETALLAAVEAAARAARRRAGKLIVQADAPAPMVRPAIDLVPVTEYLAESSVVHGTARRAPSGLVLAARGCPYGCTFCHLPFGSKLRTRAADEVGAEVEEYLARGVQNIFFLDYVFGLDRSFYSGLCSELRRLSVRWFGQTRPEVVLSADLGEWHSSGCWGMWLGIESLAVADAGVRKPISEWKIHAAIEKLRAASIEPMLFIIVGLPHETQAHYDHMRAWLEELNAPFAVSKLTLRPGTRLYDQLAPGFNNGRMPARWHDVEAVNQAYHMSLPADATAAMAQLERLPTSLFGSNEMV
jgi:anaerobic magnesium-protoporphyrin IX monomethyl ester cyclase